MRTSDAKRNPSSRTMGFTLVEVVLAIGIFSMISLGVFGVIGKLSELMVGMDDRRASEIQRRTWIETMRSQFLSLPAGVKIWGGEVEDRVSDLERSVLRFDEQDSAMRFGPWSGSLGGSHLIAVQKEEGGEMKVLYWQEREVIEGEVDGIPSIDNPVELLSDVGVLQWRFQVERGGEWKENIEVQERPILVEMTLGENRDRFVFRCSQVGGAIGAGSTRGGGIE